MLSVNNLAVTYRTRKGVVDAVRGVSFSIEKSEILGIVGESGSGKSVTCYALMRILDAGGVIKAGEANYAGIDLRRASEDSMCDIRGREISMVFQNPRAALNPIRKVGHQIEDVLCRHARANRQNKRQKAIEALDAVQIRDAAERYNAYPFELSGGMCQRVVIAIALACDPRLLIADEPTTGLDITTQKAVMELIRKLIRQREMASILITHDLGLAAQYCDRLVVMKEGVIVEAGEPDELFANPQHPYTRKLVDATPKDGKNIRSLLPPHERRAESTYEIRDTALLSVEGLCKTFETKSGSVQAVKDVSFLIKHGQSVGLVGESGSGKSTTSEMLMRLVNPSKGKIIFNGENIANVKASHFSMDKRRGDIQMVFQDATDSLNPRYTAFQSIADPLKRIAKLRKSKLVERVDELARLVGLPNKLLSRFPHQLSGGQKARVGIARAVALNPQLLVLDEPTAALDVSIQAVVLNLLVDLRAALGMSYLFVSHDLHVVRLLCDYVIVMKAGEILERGPTHEVMNNPTTEYTRSLLSAAPNAQSRQVVA